MKKIGFFFLLFFCLLLIGIKPYLNWENNTVGVTKYTVKSSEIPTAFDGYKILQISDIQGKEFENDSYLSDKIEALNADMVVFTGDLVDEGLKNSKEVVDSLFRNTMLPDVVYGVSGNHDLWTERFEEYLQEWEATGKITFLENESTVVERDGQRLYLHGISDPDTFHNQRAEQMVKQSMGKLKAADGFNILLFHRANMLDMFEESGYDLILAGHIHGGQIRIPFFGGLKSPHGDWFPKYSGGRYRLGDKTAIVSRGIGNTVSVPRVFNRPELVLITLKTE